MHAPALALKALRRCLQSTAFARDLGQYVANDVKSALGVYTYPTRKIFVIGLPKSGDAWLHSMMLDLPGFNPRRYRSLSVKDEQGRFVPRYEYDNIDESFFDNIPKRGYSAFKFHVRASERNLAILHAQALKWVVVYRDIRDLCISRYFHYRSAPNSHLYPIYQRLSLQQALDQSIEIVRDELVPWMQGWRDAARRLEGRICEVRYEDLWTDTAAELERILAFLGIRAPESFLRNAAATKIAGAQSGRDADRVEEMRLLRSAAARPDGVGDWKAHFSEPLKEQFKKVAGDLLIAQGYEKDFNW